MDIAAGLKLPFWKNKSDERLESYSASQSKNLQFMGHKKLPRFGRINTFFEHILNKYVISKTFLDNQLKISLLYLSLMFL